LRKRTLTLAPSQRSGTQHPALNAHIALAKAKHLVLLPSRALDIGDLFNSNGAAAATTHADIGIEGLLEQLAVPYSSAALRARACGAPEPESGAFWVALTPCYWQIELNGARWMAHDTSLAMTLEEWESLVQTLSGLFNAPDAQLVRHGAHMSLLCAASTPRVSALSPDLARGSAVKAHLPTPLQWQRYLNEAQMLLNDAPVNRARIARGAVPINSVWFWGAAQSVLPASLGEQHTRAAINIKYVGADVVLRGWADVCANVANASMLTLLDWRQYDNSQINAELANCADALFWLPDGRLYRFSQPSLMQRCAEFFRALVPSAGAR
jgi:hypothetical protein